MEKIALLTDSSCDLLKEEVKKYNVNVLPFRIIYKDKEFSDNVNITPTEIYNNLENEIPTTSLPSMEIVENTLNRLKQEGYTHIIGIFISNQLSGTFNSVRLMLEDNTDFETFLFDTKLLSYPVGAIVNSVGELVAQGKSFKEIIKLVPTIQENTTAYFTINTLEYLKKGGRIGRVAGTLGDMLHLKPLITLDEEGSFQSVAKVRGRKQSISKLKSLIFEYADAGKCKLWVLEGMAEKEANQLLDTLKTHPNISVVGIRPVGPAMGVHTGPGLIGATLQRVL